MLIFVRRFFDECLAREYAEKLSNQNNECGFYYMVEEIEMAPEKLPE